MDDYLLHQHSELESTHWWFVARRDILTDILERRAGRHLRVLDLGCGAGSMIDVLARFGDVTAMDTSEEAIAYCRARHPDARFTVGRVPNDLPPGGTLDLVTAFDVIEHIRDDVGALTAIRRALAPGGLLVCTVPAYQWLWGPHDDLNHHQRRYAAKGLTGALDQAGFDVEWVSYFNTLLFPAVAAMRLGRRATRPHAVPASDLSIGTGPFNHLLVRVFSAERHLLRRTRLPFGTSLVVVARRPEGP